MGSSVKIFSPFLFIIILFSWHSSSSQEIAINEVMASNALTLADEDGDFEDWIELFNYGNDPVNLEGFSLSDDYENPSRWIIPAVIIEPGQFLLIWASGKDKRVPESPLHTNFSISADGEEVLLTNPTGIRIDEIAPTPIPTDISYGRIPDGIGDWHFFHVPTPGTINDTPGFAELLKPPSFSHPAGWYNEEQEIILTTNHESAVILYTLDGSEPSIHNINNMGEEYLINFFFRGEWAEPQNLPRINKTYVYHNSIILANISENNNDLSDIITGYRDAPSIWWRKPTSKVNKGHIFRAKMYQDGNSSPIVTSSYFINDEGSKRYSLPVVSLTSETNNVFGYEEGIYVPGKIYFDNGGTHINYNKNFSGNYRESWEVPVHFELFETDGNIGFSQNLGMRIHGGGSRTRAIKGLRLYARNQYDSTNVMKYSFFPGATNIFYEQLDNFRRILLRTGGDYLNLLIDAACHQIMEPASVELQRSRPVVHFINGEYWGLANIRERQDQYQLASKYKIDPDNIIILNAPWGQGSESMVESGYPDDILKYRDLYNFVVDNNIMLVDNYEHVKEMLDVVSFIDYNIMFIYLNNTDWYGSKHFRFWRVREISEKPFHDGKWRMMVWDFDASPQTPDFDFLLNFIHPTGGGNGNNSGSPERTALLRNLLENEEFKHLFLNRFADHINSTFNPPRIKSIVNKIYNTLLPELPEHFERWRYHDSHPRYVNLFNNHANQRPTYQRQHIRNHFNIEKDIAVNLNVDNDQAGHIRINTINIHPSTPGVPDEPYPWTGIYFHGIPIEVEAVPIEGYAFSHWIGTENQMEKLLNITPDGGITLKAHFVKVEVPEVVSYWFFGTDLPNNTPLDTILPVFSQAGNPFINFKSAFEGYPFDSDHVNWRKASLERRNAPTEINYQPKANDDIPFEDSGMRGIQVKQPLEHTGRQSELIFHLPSTGYREPVFRFAALDEGAAERLVFDYSVSEGEPQWTSSGIDNSSPDLTGFWQLYEIDLSQVNEAENNPDLKVRIRFEAADLTTDEGNRITFNNFSLHGIPVNYNFFSKSTGELNDLSSWGTAPDGSGPSPESFLLHTAKFQIMNRELAELNGVWEVTGIDSRVIAGDDINELTFEVNASMDATIDVMSNATLHLSHSNIPDIGELKDGSTVIFSGEAASIPYHSFYNLTLDGIDPHFEDGGTIIIRGDITLDGNVTMPASRGGSQYSLEFSGNSDQIISSNGNIVRGYNIIFEKPEGTVSFSSGNGETIISSDNQLIMNMTGESLLEDNGITIYAGNSINIDGNPGSYNFTGTLVLAGIEEGVVNGAGSGNSFNIRNSNKTNTNPVAALNNIIIRAQNNGGEFRFRDGTSNQLRVKGDLTVESSAAGMINFYDNTLIIGGDLVIEEGYQGETGTIRSMIFDGTRMQNIVTSGNIYTDNLAVSNSENLSIHGVVEIAGILNFETGKILTGENGLVNLGTESNVTGYGNERFIDGPVGIYRNNIEKQQIIFPTGKDDYFIPLTLEINHYNDNRVLYMAELFTGMLPEYDLSAGLLEVFGDFHFSLGISGNYHISTAFASIQFDPSSIQADPDLLRIAKSENGRWTNIGGAINDNIISSTLSIDSPGILALAEQALEVNITSSADKGGGIEPEGVYTIQQGSDKTFTIRSDQGYHIKNIFIDGDPLAEASGNFVYTYIFRNIIDDRTIHAEFDLNNYQEVDVYPNPATERLWVRFRQNIEHLAVISLVSINGKTVAEKTLSPGDNTSGYINLAGIEPGAYILKIDYGGHKINRKILIL